MLLIIVPLLLSDVCAPSLPLTFCHVVSLHPSSSTFPEMSEFKKERLTRLELTTAKSEVRQLNQLAMKPLCLMLKIKLSYH